MHSLTRRLLAAALILGATVGGGVAWHRHMVARAWAAARPRVAAWPGDEAPGLAARLAAAEARIAAFPPEPDALAEFTLLCHANGLLAPALAGYRALAERQPTEPRWPHLLATLLAGYGRLDEALPWLRRTTLLAPDQVPARLRLGDALLKTNALAEAAATYRAALALDPSNPYALLGLARCDLQADRWTTARSRLQQAVGAHPDFSAAQSLLATVWERLGNAPAAALARTAADRHGRFSESADPWLDALVPYTHDLYRLLVTAATLRTAHRPTESVAVLERALTLAPHDERIHRQLGNTLVDLGRLPAARDHLAQAATLAPTQEKAHLDYVALLKSLDDTPALIAAVAAGLAGCPTSAGLHFEAGLLAAQAHDDSLAATHLAYVWQARPDEPAAALELAQIHFCAGRAPAAISLLEDVLARFPDHAPAFAQLIRYGLGTRDARTASWLDRAGRAGLPPASLTALQRDYQRRFGAPPP